jgi:hypothetical protein
LVPELRNETNVNNFTQSYDPKTGFFIESDYWAPISKFNCRLPNQTLALNYTVQWKGNDVRFRSISDETHGRQKSPLEFTVEVKGQGPTKIIDNVATVFESDDVTFTCSANASEYNRLDLTIETSSNERQTIEHDFGLISLANPENRKILNLGEIFRFAVSNSSAGNYTCLAFRQENSDGGMTIESVNAAIQVQVKNLCISSTFPHQIQAGDPQNVTWECLVAPERVNKSVTITWSKDKTIIEGGANGYTILNSSQQLFLRSPNATHAGEYKCAISTKNGYRKEYSANLTVISPPPEPSTGGMSGGGIAGIIFGCLIVIVAGVFGFLYYKRKYGDRPNNGYNSV